MSIKHLQIWERSGSVVECLSQDREVVGSSLKGKVSLRCVHEQDNSLLSTGSNQADLSRHNWKIVAWDVKNRSIKQHLQIQVNITSIE